MDRPLHTQPDAENEEDDERPPLSFHDELEARDETIRQLNRGIFALFKECDNLTARHRAWTAQHGFLGDDPGEHINNSAFYWARYTAELERREASERREMNNAALYESKLQMEVSRRVAAEERANTVSAEQMQAAVAAAFNKDFVRTLLCEAAADDSPAKRARLGE